MLLGSAAEVIVFTFDQTLHERVVQLREGVVGSLTLNEFHFRSMHAHHPQQWYRQEAKKHLSPHDPAHKHVASLIGPLLRHVC